MIFGRRRRESDLTLNTTARGSREEREEAERLAHQEWLGGDAHRRQQAEVAAHRRDRADAAESTYHRRRTPAYRTLPTDLSLADNRRILRWWSADCDAILMGLIGSWQWNWFWEVTDEVLKVAPADEVDRWRGVDPACKQRNWRNVLMHFARARAARLGLTNAIREPAWKTCPLCGVERAGDSLPFPLAKRLGIDALDICSPCMGGTTGWDSGNKDATADDILQYLRELAEVIGRVPPQGFGEGKDELLGLDMSSRVRLLELLGRKPATSRIKHVFGSWLKALVQAGVLEDGTWDTGRGIRTIARDGHECHSLGEKTIDDWLFSHGIPHEREPAYPVGRYRADWAVGDVFVEYFGLAGNPEYDEKTSKKVGICKDHRIVLVSIYPKDLVRPERLDDRLHRFLPTESD